MSHRGVRGTVPACTLHAQCAGLHASTPQHTAQVSAVHPQDLHVDQGTNMLAVQRISRDAFQSDVLLVAGGSVYLIWSSDPLTQWSSFLTGRLLSRTHGTWQAFMQLISLGWQCCI